MATPKDSKAENSFPRMVYKKGTGKQADESGRYEAEGQVVYDEQHLAKLGGEWVASPQEAAAGNKDAAKHADKK